VRTSLQSRRWAPVRDQNHDHADQEQHHQADRDEGEKSVFGALFGAGERSGIVNIAACDGRRGVNRLCLTIDCLIFGMLSIHRASIPTAPSR
jgi:hypothetical protein